MAQDEINEAEWRSPDNWWGGSLGVYHSARDNRVWVPKPVPGMGWTLNFGRRASWLWLVAILVVPVVLIALFACKQPDKEAPPPPTTTTAAAPTCFVTERSVLARAPGTPAPGPASLRGLIRLEEFPSANGGVARLEDSDSASLGASWRRLGADSILVTAFDDFLRVEMRLAIVDSVARGAASAYSDAALERDSSGTLRDFARRWDIVARMALCS